ncbi:ammonium transporter marine subtype [Ketogulonicigenium robustum]|uniref:Ammonium transporter n=1 Tax=Ketogulonicigenium robustum TaxID=92947 RepID=A0A1W6NX03_9RHOB|nr:ammonium transporter [Ketogulonicigenium robustum]ARO13683.1 ammonium transporter marine subtype [Ketogulonicigenium robustum]
MLNAKKLAGLAAVAAMLALPAHAQEAEAAVEAVETYGPSSMDLQFILNSLIMLIGGILVFWMAAGFAMLEGGLVRSKNVTMQMLKNISMFAIACFMYYLVGYMVMYPGDGWIISNIFGALGTAKLEAVGIDAAGADAYDYASTSSDFFFQVMFCATTASIVSGAVAERIKFAPFMVFTVVMTALIYPVQASWKWGGGFLDQMGFLDFAGSTVVHSVGGWAALMGIIILGPRIGKYKDGKVIPMPGSNLPLATLGTFILWMGWFGFNGASQLAFSAVGDAADVGRVMANTNAGAVGGALAALILTGVLYRKPDLTMVLNGALGGLVSITAEPLTPTLGAATLIGAVGGIIVVFAVSFLDKLKLDDVVGAVPVHLFAGIWGTIAVVFTNPDAVLWVQLYSIIVVGLFTIIASGVVWLIIKAVMGLRVSPEAEQVGLDKAELGMEAYPEFSK